MRSIPDMLVAGNTVERTGSNRLSVSGSIGSGSHASWNDALLIVDGNTMNDTGNYGIYAYAGYSERTEMTGNVMLQHRHRSVRSREQLA